MKEKIRFSIITASYNYENYIKDTINSVINQTYKNWELIIIDDGSSDNSVEVIKEFSRKDKRIKLFTHPDRKNLGLAETLKKGIKIAKNEWIAFLESDDVWRGDFLEKKVEVINKNPNFNFIFNWVEYFGDEEAIKGYHEYNDKLEKFLAEADNASELLKKIRDFNFVLTFSCVTVKKDALLKCNFDTPFDSCLDWWLFAQIIHNNSVVYIRDKLTKWRIHEKNYIKQMRDYEHFKECLLKLIVKNSKSKFLIFVLNFINKERIEKLFRPQVKMLNKILMKKNCGKKRI